MKINALVIFLIVVFIIYFLKNDKENFSQSTPSPSIPRVSTYKIDGQPDNFYIRDNSTGAFLYITPERQLIYNTLNATPFTIKNGVLYPVTGDICLATAKNLTSGSDIGIFPLDDPKCKIDRRSKFEILDGRILATSNKNLMLGNINDVAKYINAQDNIRQKTPCLITPSSSEQIPNVSIYNIEGQPNNFYIRDNTTGEFLYLTPERQLIYVDSVATPFTIKNGYLFPVNSDTCLSSVNYLTNGGNIGTFSSKDPKCTTDKRSKFEILDGRIVASVNKNLMLGNIDGTPKYINSRDTTSRLVPCIPSPSTTFIPKVYTFPFVYPGKWIDVKNVYTNWEYNDIIDYNIDKENKQKQKPYDEMSAIINNFRKDYLKMNALNKLANKNAFIEYLQKCNLAKSFSDVGGFQYQVYLTDFLRTFLVVSFDIDKKTMNTFIPWLQILINNNYNIKDNGKEDITRWDVAKNNVVLLRYKNLLYLSLLANNTRIRRHIITHLPKWLERSTEKSKRTNFKATFIGDNDRRTRSLNYTRGSLWYLQEILAILLNLNVNVNDLINLINECTQTWNEDRKAGGVLYKSLAGGDQIHIQSSDLKLLDIELIKKLNMIQILNGDFR